MARQLTDIDLVLIGGSSGAFTVVRDLVAGLSPSFRAALVVALHRPPSDEGLLGRALAPYWSVELKEAEDKDELLPGRVFLAPANYHLLIESPTRLALSVDDPVNFSRPSIDVLFESAAAVAARRTLAVLLSGASADGARGLQAIAEQGGATAVQHPAHAEASMMPRAALDLMIPDFVLPPQGLAELLQRMAP